METLQIIIAVIFGIGFLSCIVIPIWIKIEEKNNQKNKTSKGCANLILAILIVLIAFAVLGMCSEMGGKWEPRHTQATKPVKINVNNFIFISS